MLVSLTFLKKVIWEKPNFRKKKRKTKISFLERSGRPTFKNSKRKFTAFYLILRKLTKIYRAGKTHFLQYLTLIYRIIPKLNKNYHILSKIFSNSHLNFFTKKNFSNKGRLKLKLNFTTLSEWMLASLTFQCKKCLHYFLFFFIFYSSFLFPKPMFFPYIQIKQAMILISYSSFFIESNKKRQKMWKRK